MSAPRIIAGQWRGRRLKVPAGRDVRPTSERMREALFNILGSAVIDARVLDLFAGCGAIGLEALSRGAQHVTFVEQNSIAREHLTVNVSMLAATAKCRVMPGDATRFPGSLEKFDIVYLDPPYAKPCHMDALANLRAQGCLSGGTRIIAEHGSKQFLDAGPGFVITDQRRYGAGTLSFVELI